MFRGSGICREGGRRRRRRFCRGRVAGGVIKGKGKLVSKDRFEIMNTTYVASKAIKAIFVILALELAVGG